MVIQGYPQVRISIKNRYSVFQTRDPPSPIKIARGWSRDINLEVVHFDDDSTRAGDRDSGGLLMHLSPIYKIVTKHRTKNK